MGGDHPHFSPLSRRVTAVVATRNRADSLRRTVDNLLALPDPPAVIVVDNASTDGTEDEHCRRRPDVDYVRLSDALGVGGEEHLLAVDLARAGWELAYVDDVVARHDPSPSRDHQRRLGVVARNELWLAWLRRPAVDAARMTFRAGRRAVRDSAARAGLAEALRGLPWVARARRSVPPSLGQALRVLEATA